MSRKRQRITANSVITRRINDEAPTGKAADGRRLALALHWSFAGNLCGGGCIGSFSLPASFTHSHSIVPGGLEITRNFLLGGKSVFS
jgi:hypothetical protein